LLEEHQLGEQILGQVNLDLQAQEVRITSGTIVHQERAMTGILACRQSAYLQFPCSRAIRALFIAPLAHDSSRQSLDHGGTTPVMRA
jgi:hypothetical protein